jgi:hypothetical protein
MMKLIRAIYESGKIILTGTGVEPHIGGHITVTGTGVEREWILISEQYPWLKFMAEDQPCYCSTIPNLRMPCPGYPCKDFEAVWNGSILELYWLPVWDLNDDGKVNLSDLCHFAVGYVKGKWTLADFAAFADLYGKSAVYGWRYRKA